MRICYDMCATAYNTLEHSTAHCNTLQCVFAMICVEQIHSQTHTHPHQHMHAHAHAHARTYTRILSATHCNTCYYLQHTATRELYQGQVYRNTHTREHDGSSWRARGQSTREHRLFCCTTRELTQKFLRLPHCQLQHTATTATHCNAMQHTTAHYSTPQHTPTYCTTLQHTAPGKSHKEAPYGPHTKTNCVTVCKTLQQVSATRKHLMGHTPLNTT